MKDKSQKYVNNVTITEEVLQSVAEDSPNPGLQIVTDPVVGSQVTDPVLQVVQVAPLVNAPATPVE